MRGKKYKRHLIGNKQNNNSDKYAQRIGNNAIETGSTTWLDGGDIDGSF